MSQLPSTSSSALSASVDRIAMQGIKRGLLSPKNFKFRRNGSKNGGFRGKWGLHVKLSVRDPSKGTSLRGTASFDVFCVKVGAGVLAVGDWKNPQNRKKPRQRCAQTRAYAQKRNPLSDLYKILQGDRHPRRNHPNKFWLRSVKGLLGGEGLNMPIPHRLPLSPLQNCRTTVRVCKVTKGPIH